MKRSLWDSDKGMGRRAFIHIAIKAPFYWKENN